MKVNSETSMCYQSSEDSKDSEEMEKFNQPFQRDDDFQGPVEGRKCMDIPWAISLFLSTLLALSILIYSTCYSGLVCGESSRLLHGHDYRGQVCGEGALKKYEYTFFVQPEESLAATCLDGCPILHDYDAVCLYDAQHEVELVDLPCYEAYLAKAFYNYYCLPSDPSLRHSVTSYLYSWDFTVTRLFGDVLRAWDLIGAAVLAGVLVAGTSVLCLMSHASRWLLSLLGVLMVGGCTIGLGFLLYAENSRVADHYCGDFGPVEMEACTHPRDHYNASICLMFLLAVFGLAFAWQTPKLLQAQSALYLAVCPIKDVISVALVPLCGAMLSAAALVVLMYSAANLASIGVVTEVHDPAIPDSQRKDVKFDLLARWLIIPLTWVVLWWVAVVSFWVEFVTSSVAQQWYYAKDRRNVPVALFTALRHSVLHIGSLAYAAVVLPLIVFPRNFILAIKRAIGKIQSGDKERCGRLWHLCISGYERWLKYKVEQSVAYQALWGEGWGAASKKAYFLVERRDAGGLLESAHYGVWVVELGVVMAGPVLSYYWVLFNRETINGEHTKFITSGLWLCLISLLFSWSLSSVLRGFIRGSFHGVLISHLCEKEMFPELSRVENMRIGLMVETFAAENSASIVAEESLKPIGIDYPEEFYKEKMRSASRIEMLKETIDVGDGRKDEEMERDDVDEFAKTGIDFASDMNTIVTEGDGRPWTPAIRTKPIILPKLPPSQADDQSASRSIPIDDTRPVFPPLRHKNDTEEDLLPDFRPYRFVEMIKENKDKEEVRKRVKSRGNRVIPTTPELPEASARSQISPPEKVRIKAERKSPLRSKVL